MPSSVPYVIGPVLAGGLALLALWFAWRQWRLLAWAGTQADLSADDRRFHTRMALRRLVGCLLMLALAALLAGLFGMGILERLDEIMVDGGQAKKEGRKLSPEQADFVWFSMKYVGVTASALFGLLAVAFVDVMAIRRWGNRHRKRIRDDRAAMLERQLPLLRRERDLRRGEEPGGSAESVGD